MKPLATPVLGGMLSSTALVLIVTPVLFYWLREREMRQAESRESVEESGFKARPAIGSAD